MEIEKMIEIHKHSSISIPKIQCTAPVKTFYLGYCKKSILVKYIFDHTNTLYKRMEIKGKHLLKKLIKRSGEGGQASLVIFGPRMQI